MNEMMRVLIADGDRNAKESLCAALTNFGYTVHAASDGGQALGLLSALSPDAMVLSLVLPTLDGFGVLESLSSTPIRRYPSIIVLNPLDEYAKKRAEKLGADMVLPKPTDPQTLIHGLQSTSVDPSVLARQHTQRRTDVARQQLLEIGMQESLKGFHYLCDAVALVSTDDRLLRQATSKLYPRIAAAYSVTDHSVERAIRHAIETTWTRGSVLAIHRVFGNSIDPQRGKPTNTECIAMLSEQLWERLTSKVYQ